jgi:hypothetical protein
VGFCFAALWRSASWAHSATTRAVFSAMRVAAAPSAGADPDEAATLCTAAIHASFSWGVFVQTSSVASAPRPEWSLTLMLKRLERALARSATSSTPTTVPLPLIFLASMVSES